MEERQETGISIGRDIISELEEILETRDQDISIGNFIETILIEYIINKGGNIEAYRKLFKEVKNDIKSIKDIFTEEL